VIFRWPERIWRRRIAVSVSSNAGVAAARDIRDSSIQIGLDEKEIGRRIGEAQQPLSEQLRALTAQIARERAIIPPIFGWLRADSLIRNFQQR
jgi:hypothetical protein